MGSKLATIIGLMLFFMSVLFATDLIILNVQYSSLNAAASNVAIIFSRKGRQGLNDVSDYLESLFDDTVRFLILNDSNTVDSFITFSLNAIYEPIFIKRDYIQITVKRSAYIGNYIL